MSHSTAASSTSAATQSAHLRAVARLLSVVRRRAGRWIVIEAVALAGLAAAAAFWGSLALDRLLDGLPVDALVPEEVLVLRGEHRVDEMPGDARERDP